MERVNVLNRMPFKMHGTAEESVLNQQFMKRVALVLLWVKPQGISQRILLDALEVYVLGPCNKEGQKSD